MTLSYAESLLQDVPSILFFHYRLPMLRYYDHLIITITEKLLRSPMIAYHKQKQVTAFTTYFALMYFTSQCEPNELAKEMSGVIAEYVCQKINSRSPCVRCLRSQGPNLKVYRHSLYLYVCSRLIDRDKLIEQCTVRANITVQLLLAS